MKGQLFAHGIMILVALIFAGMGFLMLAAPAAYWKFHRWLHRLSGGPQNGTAESNVARLITDSPKTRFWIRVAGLFYLVIIFAFWFMIFRQSISAR
jgi:hypothetical protein